MRSLRETNQRVAPQKRGVKMTRIDEGIKIEKKGVVIVVDQKGEATICDVSHATTTGKNGEQVKTAIIRPQPIQKGTNHGQV